MRWSRRWHGNLRLSKNNLLQNLRFFSFSICHEHGLSHMFRILKHIDCSKCNKGRGSKSISELRNSLLQSEKEILRLQKWIVIKGLVYDDELDEERKGLLFVKKEKCKVDIVLWTHQEGWTKPPYYSTTGFVRRFDELCLWERRNQMREKESKSSCKENLARSTSQLWHFLHANISQEHFLVQHCSVGI